MQKMSDDRSNRTRAIALKTRIDSLVEEEVNIGRVQPNSWNFNEMTIDEMRAVTESIKKYGRIYPCIVRERDDGAFEIIDGEHRFLSQLHLNYTTIKIKNLGEVSDIVAQELMLILNETRGEPNLKRLGTLVSEMVDREGSDAVIKKLPYDPAQLRDLLAIKEMDFEGLKSKWEKQFASKGVISPREQEQGCQHEWESFSGRQCINCKLLLES